MATIQITNFTLTAQPGGKVHAQLDYTVNWAPADLFGWYNHSVILRGSDPVKDDNLAPMNANTTWQFPFGPQTNHSAFAVIDQDKLADDPDLNLVILALRNKDEVYARVTVTPLAAGQMRVEADSPIQAADFG